MPIYQLVIAYDGTDYFGWQRQPDQPTITGILEERFHSVFKKEIALVGASRTDAGVHALGQVAGFALDTLIEPPKLMFAWNNALPKDIVIRSVQQAADDFHPQRNVEEKTYHYYFFEQRPLPFIARYGFFVGKIDYQKLHEGLQLFVGTHDFRSFCTGYEAVSTIRTIHAITVSYFRRYGIYRISIQGPSFLRYMIRRIVGACLDVAAHPSKDLQLLSHALEAKDPHQHLHVAPPEGLVLYKINYRISS